MVHVDWEKLMEGETWINGATQERHNDHKSNKRENPRKSAKTTRNFEIYLLYHIYISIVANM
jgi:hypothetical protein